VISNVTLTYVCGLCG